MLGADISISHLLFRALLPATLGTLVGGGFVIGAVYWYVFDSMDTITYLRERIRYGLSKPAIDSRSPAFTPSTSLSTSSAMEAMEVDGVHLCNAVEDLPSEGR